MVTKMKLDQKWRGTLRFSSTDAKTQRNTGSLTIELNVDDNEDKNFKEGKTYEVSVEPIADEDEDFDDLAKVPPVPGSEAEV